ncbi:hypothetical protein N780_17990 [Pontibacillus chungwhensis BH030062]|uniref:Tetratricopeptide repeat protein n=1 Tax=Pontibacillus chungwhensis BH030062 TaxID=1385513 RepID=A0A0A2UTB2_9BACI|nr:tetratricopeptide repeat protein [Pontibacillus chungwhensis]KGP91542.1 hypothetical protein N780_17990 [Pontibacillus chungwhensis BH030062]
MHTSNNNTGGAVVDNIIPFTPEGEFYFNKGVRAFRKREFEKASKWLRRAVELSPKQPVYQCQLSVVHTETGDYHTANQILMNVLADFGHEYVDCYYLISNNYAHLGLFQDAKKYAKEYLNKAPEGDFKEEAEQLVSVLDIEEEEDEDDDWAFEEEDELMMHQESAFYYMERQQWKEALPILEEMIRLFPNFVSAKHDYAVCLFFAGEEQEAIELEEQWHEREPFSLHSMCNLAVFYFHQGKAQQSQGHIQKLRNVYPIGEQQKLRVAATLTQVGEYAAAYDRFCRLEKGKLKGHLSYYKWFSIAAYHTGEPSKALSLWEEGCTRHPNLAEQGGPWQQG